MIDSESASASEITARVLQLEKRATIVGDRSSGHVMTSLPFFFDYYRNGKKYEYGANITINNVIMNDGKSLEKVGVIPDVTVIPTGIDLAENRDVAFSFASSLFGVSLSSKEAFMLVAEKLTEKGTLDMFEENPEILNKKKN